MAMREPRATARIFSPWAMRLLRAMQPKVIPVFGQCAGESDGDGKGHPACCTDNQPSEKLVIR